MTVDQQLQRRVARAELSRRAFIVGSALVAAFVVAALLTLSIQVRRTQLEGTPTGQRLLESSNRVLDCTSPDGECYKRSQKRTADVVTTLNLGALYAIFCTDRLPRADIKKIQACVRRLYDENAAE